MDLETYLTPDEVAARLAISKHTLSAWRRIPERRGPPWIEVGGLIRYRESELDAWLASRTRNG